MLSLLVRADVIAAEPSTDETIQTAAIPAPTQAADQSQAPNDLPSEAETALQDESRPSASTPGQDLIVLLGAPGTDDYRDEFQTWAERWKDAAQRAKIDCTIIGEFDTTVASQSSDDTASETDAQKFRDALKSASLSKSAEPLWLVYIGHGTFDGRTARWNLHGPDLSAEELAELCGNIQRPLAVIVCASCSAPFLNALSGTDRVIVTATKDGNQIQYSRFGDAMSLAISSLDADINRDGQTSLLEAWLFASRRTADFYRTEGRLATEHSLLDDNGDAMGVRAELYEGDRIAQNVTSPETVDGRLAARWHLLRSDEEQRLTSEQRQERDALENEIEALRRRKGSLEESEYLQQLEALLLPLAKIYENAEKARTAQ